MSFETRVNALATAIGGDIKQILLNQGSLASLSTTAKGNLVAAINEIFALAQSAGAQINDAAGDGNTTETWSANKIHDELVAAIAALRTEVTNGAGAALDTFGELAAALGNDSSFAATIATSLGNRVRFDAAQTLTAPQKAQALANIGAVASTDIGNFDADLVAVYTAAKA